MCFIKTFCLSIAFLMPSLCGAVDQAMDLESSEPLEKRKANEIINGEPSSKRAKFNPLLPPEMWLLISDFCPNIDRASLSTASQELHELLVPQLIGTIDLGKLDLDLNFFEKAPILRRLKYIIIKGGAQKKDETLQALDYLWGENGLNPATHSTLEILRLKNMTPREEDLQAITLFPNLIGLSVEGGTENKDYLQNLKNNKLQSLEVPAGELALTGINHLTSLTSLDLHSSSRLYFPDAGATLNLPWLISLNLENSNFKISDLKKFECRNLVKLNAKTRYAEYDTGFRIKILDLGTVDIAALFPKLESFSISFKNCKVLDLILPHTLKSLDIELFGRENLPSFYQEIGNLQSLQSLRIQGSLKDLSLFFSALNQLTSLNRFVMIIFAGNSHNFESMTEFSGLPPSLSFFAINYYSSNERGIQKFKDFINKIAHTENPPETLILSYGAKDEAIDIIREACICNKEQSFAGVKSQDNLWKTKKGKYNS